jgi:hypothetical protein
LVWQRNFQVLDEVWVAWEGVLAFVVRRLCRSATASMPTSSIQRRSEAWAAHELFDVGDAGLLGLGWFSSSKKK